ncbi:esterase-like activity of phytase family protein [Brevundimonas sp. LjRoot202]|uniref:esterase-like activity of phytase family protein n=1 Tax=Brevundimonas sp. LjRoot202 TaxID=3342281 RepID=UPI003ECE15C5
MRFSALAAVAAALALSACATSVPAPVWTGGHAGWTAAEAEVRPIGLGIPGGAALANGVRFAGGVELVLDPGSPLHSLSDLKLVDDGDFVSVSDAGDLVRGRLRLDAAGRLAGVDSLRWRRLTLPDGSPIADKADGDAEGLFLGPDGLAVAFERRHRLWAYGPLEAPTRPTPLASPDIAFPLNDGMEGVSAAPGGWRVAGESGGVWDCAARGCRVVTAPPTEPTPDSDYRITGMDRDPGGDGFWVVERRFRPPVDVRGRIRRMAADGSLGPVLVELSLPSTVDNFEGIAAVGRGDGVRLYILSDDNNNPHQRTLLLAFDVTPAR